MATNDAKDHEDLESLPESTTIQWCDSNVDVRTLDNTSGLPQVVKFDDVFITAKGEESLAPGLKIYANQAVLFHTRACKNHVKARTIYHDRQGPYYEVGQTLDIPDDFDGKLL